MTGVSSKRSDSSFFDDSGDSDVDKLMDGIQNQRKKLKAPRRSSSKVICHLKL